MLFFRKRKTKIDEAMDAILDKMKTLEANSDEYTDMVKNLETLSKAKSYESEKEKRVKLDTIVLGAVNLLGIVLILKHEKVDIITSKALGFILKGRV